MNYFTMLERLSNVTRWCRDNPIDRESLLEHTGWVCTMSLHIATQLRQHGDFVDVGEMLSKAVLHDIEEGLTGDISGPSKHYSPQMSDEVREMESDAVVCWMGFLGIRDMQYHALWDNSKNDSNMAGAIVKISDYLAAVYKIWVECCMRGNNGFKRVAKELLVYSPQQDDWEFDVSDWSHMFLNELRVQANLILERVIKGENVDAEEIPWLV